MNVKERLAKAVCLFLAEMLRTRRVSLERGSDIAAQIVSRLDSIENETEFLDAVRKLEFEFQELHYLAKDLTFYHQITDREKVEKLVREFAIQCLPQDPERVLVVMDEALREGVTLNDLRKKYQDFNEFVATHI